MTLTETLNGIQDASKKIIKLFNAIRSCTTRYGGLHYKLPFHHFLKAQLRRMK
jgi:hypothetical protein